MSGTYKACVRKNGTHLSGINGEIRWNEKLLEAMNEEMEERWEDFLDEGIPLQARVLENIVDELRELRRRSRGMYRQDISR